jgi:hypothetical protein
MIFSETLCSKKFDWIRDFEGIDFIAQSSLVLVKKRNE